MLMKVNDSDMIGVENGPRLDENDLGNPPTPVCASAAAAATGGVWSNAAAPVVVPVVAEAKGENNMACDEPSSSLPSLPSLPSSPESSSAATSSSAAASSPHLILAQWIEDTLGEPLAAKHNLWASLKSGVVLCKLVNKIKPDTIMSFNKNNNKKPSFPQQQQQQSSLLRVHHARDNLNIYVGALKQLGVEQKDLFDVPDMFKLARGERMREVLLQGIVRSVRALQALAAEAEAESQAERSQSEQSESAPTVVVAAPVVASAITHIVEVAADAGNHDTTLPIAIVDIAHEVITPIVAEVARVQSTVVVVAPHAVARLQQQQQQKEKEAEEDDASSHSLARNQEEQALLLRGADGSVVLSVIEEGNEENDDEMVLCNNNDNDNNNSSAANYDAADHDAAAAAAAYDKQKDVDLEEEEGLKLSDPPELTAEKEKKNQNMMTDELEELRQQLQQRDSALASKEAEIRLLLRPRTQAADTEEATYYRDLFAREALWREDQEKEHQQLKKQLSGAIVELSSAHDELLGVVSAKDSELQLLQGQLRRMRAKVAKMEEDMAEQKKQKKQKKKKEMEEEEMRRAHLEAEALLREDLAKQQREIEVLHLKLWRAEAGELAAKQKLSIREREVDELSANHAASLKSLKEECQEASRRELALAALAHEELLQMLGCVSARKDSELQLMQAQLQQTMAKMAEMEETKEKMAKVEMAKMEKMAEVETIEAAQKNKEKEMDTRPAAEAAAADEAEGDNALLAKEREILLLYSKLWRAEAGERAAKRELAKSPRGGELQREREELSKKLAASFKEEQEQQEQQQQEQQERGQVGQQEEDDSVVNASHPPSPSLSSFSISSSSPSSLCPSLSPSPSSLSLSSSPSPSSSISSSSSSSSSSPALSSSAASVELSKEQKKKGKKKRLSSWLRAAVRRGGELAGSLSSSS